LNLPNDILFDELIDLLDKVMEHSDFLGNTIQVGKEGIEPFPLYQHMFHLGI
jgi:hypothetical protein